MAPSHLRSKYSNLGTATNVKGRSDLSYGPFSSPVSAAFGRSECYAGQRAT
jgi:hypothetical protein